MKYFVSKINQSYDVVSTLYGPIWLWRTRPISSVENQNIVSRYVIHSEIQCFGSQLTNYDYQLRGYGFEPCLRHTVTYMYSQIVECKIWVKF